MNLTPHQTEVFDRLKEFVQSRDHQVFVLRGYAGTGKTTLAGFLLSWMREASVQYTPVLLASTGRAARILSDKTGWETNTLHGHIYTLEGVKEEQKSSSQANDYAQVDEATGQLVMNFSVKSLPPSERAYLFIVDEASMLSHIPSTGNSIAKFGTGSVLNDFFSYLRKQDKVIFIGDPAQLPPVVDRTAFSPALDENFLAEKYGCQTLAVELTEVLRQEEQNPILELATRLRMKLEHRDFSNWERLFKEVSGDNIFTPYTQDIMISRYLDVVKEDWDKGIVLTHSNKQAYYLNLNIRKKLAGGKYIPHPLKGEVLMVSQNSYYVPLANGDRVILLHSEKGGVRKGIKFSKVRVKALHNGEEYETLLLQDFLFTHEANLPANLQQQLLIDFDQRMRERGINRKDERYEPAMRNDPYLNALRAKFGYAVTCHKAQGGEWPHCFLNLSDTLNLLADEIRFRWLYTAVSRAKEKLDVKPIYKGNTSKKRTASRLY